MNYREPTPPEQDLVLRSTVVKVKDNAEKVGSGKPSVQVDISLYEVRPPASLLQEGLENLQTYRACSMCITDPAC